MNARGLGAAAIGIAIAAGVFVLARGWVDGPSAASGNHGTPAAAGAEQPDEPGSGAAATPPAAPRSPGARQIRVRVIPGGERTLGQVEWIASPQRIVPRIFAGAPDERLSSLALRDGEACLSASRTDWLWLRVSCRIDGRPHQGYRSLAPGSDPGEVVFAWEDAKSRILVHAYDLDALEPLSGEMVNLYLQPFLGRTSRPIQTVRLGTDGTAVFPALEFGSYIIALGTEAPEAPGSDARAVVLPLEAGPHDAIVRLARRGGTQLLRIVADVRDPGHELRAGTRLILRRLDDGSGSLHVAGAVAGHGVQRFQIRVPPGQYEIASLPVGALLPLAGREPLCVGTDRAEFAVVLMPARESICLSLTGILPQEFPVRLMLRHEAQDLGQDPDLLAVGRIRWPGPDVTIPWSGSPAHLIAVNAHSAWISVSRIERAQAAPELPMIPATIFEVRAPHRDRTAPRPMALEIAGGGIATMVGLVPSLPSGFGPELVQDRARVVVPNGRYELALVSADGNPLTPARTVIAGGGVLQVAF